MANLEVWGALGLLPKLVSHRMPEQSDDKVMKLIFVMSHVHILNLVLLKVRPLCVEKFSSRVSKQAA